MRLSLVERARSEIGGGKSWRLCNERASAAERQGRHTSQGQSRWWLPEVTDGRGSVWVHALVRSFRVCHGLRLGQKCHHSAGGRVQALFDCGYLRPPNRLRKVVVIV